MQIVSLNGSKFRLYHLENGEVVAYQRTARVGVYPTIANAINHLTVKTARQHEEDSDEMPAVRSEIEGKGIATDDALHEKTQAV